MTNEISWNHELLEQIHWHWTGQLRPRLDGLTDDEYFWEPRRRLLDGPSGRSGTRARTCAGRIR